MYNFNKRKLLSILISPLMFNGFLFGMEYENKENIDSSNSEERPEKKHKKKYEKKRKTKHVEEFEKKFKERLEEIKKSKITPILKKLNIEDDAYEVLGSGAYGTVIKLKGNDDFAWKFTYSTIKNTENFYNQNECFELKKTALSLKGRKIDNVCEILDVIDFGSKSEYKGEYDISYNLAIKMKYVKGKTLDKYIKDRKEKQNKYKISELYNLIISICDVLQKFRNLGLIYSDIKEENIMIDEDNGFNIVDADSATIPELTKKNSGENATEGEKNNIDLIKLVEMTLRIVRGNKDKSQKNQFDLLDFERRIPTEIVKKLKEISGRIKQGKNMKGQPINSLNDFKVELLKC